MVILIETKPLVIHPLQNLLAIFQVNALGLNQFQLSGFLGSELPCSGVQFLLVRQNLFQLLVDQLLTQLDLLMRIFLVAVQGIDIIAEG